jgi:HK97 gp10 family phage protein
MAYSVSLDTDLLDRMEADLEDQMSDVIDTTLALIESSTKANIVTHDLIDTGFMLNSVHPEKTSKLEGQVIVGAEYGIYHELGTRYLPARPFLGPAVDMHTQDFYEAAADVLRSYE